MIDVNNGIPSMQNPFKIPLKPKIGVWSIEAAYSEDFTTMASADFEVKEYVLPSFSILVEPEANYISYGTFQSFSFKISARYLHGAPLVEAEVFVRYGYVSGKSPPVIIPNSVTRKRLSSSGEVEVRVNMQEILASHSGPKDLNNLVGKYLYVAVLLQEDTGGISQEAELATVKFVKSPYSLSLVSTPPFIKPGLPYNIQVLVKDHLGQPVSRVPVRLVERTLSCPDRRESQSDGLAVFICNTPRDANKAVLKFETSDASLPLASQASLSLEAVAYFSPNQRYLYIDPPLARHSLEVGRRANIKVYSATPTYLPVKTLSFLVLSRGRVVEYGCQSFTWSADSKQTVSFDVSPAMVPSIRLLVYYVLYGEGTAELVAESVWMDVRDNCVNGLKTELSYSGQDHRPKSPLQLDIRANQEGLVALSAVDTALFTLRHTHPDPVTKVLRHIEQSDQGCGGGGGKDNADVFRLAGLTFITNANAHPSQTDETCTAAVRPKRSLTEEEKRQKVESYGVLGPCCEEGLRYSPSSISCLQFAVQKFRKHPRCRLVFRTCCEYHQQNLDQDGDLILGRIEMGADFDQAPSLVRSYFPESWMWEVQHIRPGLLSVSRTLPDSLTTWELRAVGIFKNGICVAEPVRVSVSLPLSVDVPLPYQLIRGEQLELRGSVYNQQTDSIRYCVTLTVGPALCLLHSQPSSRGPGLRSSACQLRTLAGEDVGKLSFTLLALEPGEHTLNFTLHTPQGDRDILEKTLVVVPEGVRTEVFSGGRLDPQGLYGSEKRIVELKNRASPNLVPHTSVERLLTINGEILGEVLSVLDNPEGLRQLVNLPAGSAEAELAGLLPLVHIYQYLETTGRWGILGNDIQKNSEEVRQRIKNGVISINSFRNRPEHSSSVSYYSMWKNREASTWLTALVVKTLGQVDSVVPVDHQFLSQSVHWLISSTQNQDGSFKELSSFKPNKVMAAGADAMDQSVYLTSFVLIGLHRATQIRDPVLQLRYHDDSMKRAANYISQHASGVQSVYVRAVATYALTLHDPDSYHASLLLTSLEARALEKGHPAELRFWRDSGVSSDWLRPDESSGLTVETTAYCLLTALLKGRIHYANPILTWLTQDQHYGEAFYSTQDTVMTLEAVTEYSRVVPKAVLDLDINIRYSRMGPLGQVELRQTRPVATPVQVTRDDDIIVSTGFGKGVSHVKLKTVSYQTTSSTQNCDFDLTIEVVGPDVSGDPSRRAPHLVACAKYKPPPNEVVTESSLTVMKIQLPTGLEAYLEDLRQFRDGREPLISHYELQGDTVIIQMDSVPSDVFLCVGFRIRVEFRVGMASESLYRVYEPQAKGSMCTKQYSYREQKLQRLCVAQQCQCMKGACATYRGDVDLSLTADKRIQETCQPHIKYAYKVKIKSSSSEGDFVIYTATVVEVLKNPDKELEGVGPGSEVELVKKVTCSSAELQNHAHFLVMGSSGTEIPLANSFKYRFPLDSDAVVELWPTDCSSNSCLDYISQLDEYALDLQLGSCPETA
ncbi:complement C5-like [Polymixia lowei]